jgi:hypothetical protein
LKNKQLALSRTSDLTGAISDFCRQYTLFSEKKIDAYAALFSSYTDYCSPVEASEIDKRLSGKFLAVFYSINEHFLAKQNSLEATNFLAAKKSFLSDLESVMQSRYLDHESAPDLGRFLDLFDELWKEMKVEADWFGSVAEPSLSEYKRNREATITIHPFVEMYRLLCFSHVDTTQVKDLVSLVAKIVYYDNDLRSKDDLNYAKPNLVSLVMREDCVVLCNALRVARSRLQRERADLFMCFQQRAEMAFSDVSLRPFVLFLEQCIVGNNHVMDLHQERYASSI